MIALPHIHAPDCGYRINSPISESTFPNTADLIGKRVPKLRRLHLARKARKLIAALSFSARSKRFDDRETMGAKMQFEELPRTLARSPGCQRNDGFVDWPAWTSNSAWSFQVFGHGRGLNRRILVGDS
jgi:hypothetical protein